MASEPTHQDRRARERRQRQTLPPSSSAHVTIRQAAALPTNHPRRPVELRAVVYDAAPVGRPDVPGSSSTSSSASSAGRPDVQGQQGDHADREARPPVDAFAEGMGEVLDRMGLPPEDRAKFEAFIGLMGSLVKG